MLRLSTYHNKLRLIYLFIFSFVGNSREEKLLWTEHLWALIYPSLCQCNFDLLRFLLGVLNLATFLKGYGFSLHYDFLLNSSDEIWNFLSSCLYRLFFLFLVTKLTWSNVWLPYSLQALCKFVYVKQQWRENCRTTPWERQFFT